MKTYILIEDLSTHKYLNLDMRWRISWVKDKHDATPIENNEFYYNWLEKKGLCKYDYLWHLCDKNGGFI